MAITGECSIDPSRLESMRSAGPSYLAVSAWGVEHGVPFPNAFVADRVSLDDRIPHAGARTWLDPNTGPQSSASLSLV
jgi:hypothetical protein